MKDSEAVKCKPPVQAAGKDFELSWPLIYWSNLQIQQMLGFTQFYINRNNSKKTNHVNTHHTFLIIPRRDHSHMFPSSLWVKSSWSVQFYPHTMGRFRGSGFLFGSFSEGSKPARNCQSRSSSASCATWPYLGPNSEVFQIVKVGKTLNITELKWENHGQLWKIKDNLVLSSIFQRFPKDNHCFTQRNVTACLSKSIFSSWGPISNGLMDIRYYILLSALASLFGPFCFLAFGPRNYLQISRNYLQSLWLVVSTPLK